MSGNSLKDFPAEPCESLVCGPALPPHMRKNMEMNCTQIQGPPPPCSTQSTLGPSISEEMRRQLTTAVEEIASEEKEEYDEDIVGPMPVRPRDHMSETQVKLEERALEIKMASLDKSGQSNQNVREEWMLELPEAKAKFLGLAPRSFRAKQGPDMSDRSSWTDTPKEKSLKAKGVVVVSEEKLKQQLKEATEEQYIKERDKEQERAARAYKKKHKRDKSMLEIHRKKLEKKKKKKKEKGEADERRPFSREVDLKVNKFDEAQSKVLIKRAHQLNDRFSSGQAKYL